VEAAISPKQLELPGVAEQPDVTAIVEKTAELVIQRTIDIPRIIVVPTGDVTTGFDPFTLDVASINYPPPDRDILIQHLRTHEQETLSTGGAGIEESRLEDYVVRGLIDFDDISYDDHADLLYDLAGQLVTHLRSYLADDNEVRDVLQYRQRTLAEFIHAQMMEHHWEKAAGYDVVVRQGFTELKPCAYTAMAENPIRRLREAPVPKSQIVKLVYGGFQRCLYPVQKFRSDTERILAIILERESQKWFSPIVGQFQIFYRLGNDHREYQPDFVAETADSILMMETKSEGRTAEVEVLAKRDAAIQWCRHASDHAAPNGSKPWRDVLIPHDVVAENMTLLSLVEEFVVET